ncbi:hypothetical protein GH714_018156 [Hevea brasiliensis]|uniref:Uncharacterized protein n=1 Tax=Hevea brasiliensis TaxID=3981 RepID=A0A6A6N204_HEVBR|nr:hypothetical protein GH714_018156 [Hevea brasiliensis]
MTTFSASSFAGNSGLCGGPLVLKFSDDDSNNGRNNDGSYGGRKDEADEGIGFIDKWLYLSIGLGYAVVDLICPEICWSLLLLELESFCSPSRKWPEEDRVSYEFIDREINTVNTSDLYRVVFTFLMHTKFIGLAVKGIHTGQMVLCLVEAIDVYLAGTVMLIFGMGEAKMDEDQLT